METNITSSFIPTDATSLSNQRGSGSALYDVVLLISIVLLVASGALAVGVFLYSQYLTADVVSKKAQVDTAQKAFQPARMQEITRLDDRMRAADVVLGSHLALSAFFRLLEQATLESVSFKTLQLEASDPKAISIKMTGVAQSVNAVALQADTFTKTGALTSPLFSNIARREGGVHFDFSALLNVDAVRYSSQYNGQQGNPQNQAPAPVTPEPTTPASSLTPPPSKTTAPNTTLPTPTL